MYKSVVSPLLSLLLIAFFASSISARFYLTGDLDGNYRVDFEDLRTLSWQWLDPSCLNPGCRANLDGINGINMVDFALLAENWAIGLTAEAHPHLSGDTNGDHKVDYKDLNLLLYHWLDSSCASPSCQADLDGISSVNMSDFALWAADWTANYSQITLVINEFMAENNSFIQDPKGGYDDWIEIYNYGEYAIDIGGMYITDDVSDVNDWYQIPDDNPQETTIDAHSYLLIWADEESSQGPLHVNFGLNAGGEEDIGFFDKDGSTLIDSIISFPAQGADNSYGRLPNGIGSWQIFIHDTNTPPTPGEINGSEPATGVVINEIMYHPYHSTIGNIEPEDIKAEYIELFNRGMESVSLAGWQFTNGVDFVFPNDVTIEAGEYLIVAADVNSFTVKYPSITNAIGGWCGRLSNSGEVIELIDNMGVNIDRVRYADEGDWAVREEGPLHYGHRGWVWYDEHDGGGKSLELVNPALPNQYGQNWAASVNNEGTPGVTNSVNYYDIAPMILDVRHRPIIPKSTFPVTVKARIIDELTIGITVTLNYRVDGDPGFTSLTMYDDATHGDDRAGDGVYAAEIPAYPNDTIIEFYLEASDLATNSRTWPAESLVGGLPDQVTNLLYQVDDSFDPNTKWVPTSKPIYRLIMTEAERAELEDIGSDRFESSSDAQMNATFISVDGVDKKLRYNVGIRNRGHGTRDNPPNNYRVNFPHDRSWKGVTAVNLNTKYTYLQLVGNAIFRMSGLVQSQTTAVHVKVNGQNLAESGQEMYGSYVHVEVIDSDFINTHFPNDNAGNAYKAMRVGHEADLRYEGTDPDSYRHNYFKSTNVAEDDWSDLIGLTYALSDNTSDEDYVQEINCVLNVEQWLRFFAVNTLLDNSETTLANGNGDDYYFYRGIEDPRVVLIQHDLDSIFGMGQSAGSVTEGIFEATDIPALKRFLEHPRFVGRYYFHLKDLIETTFSAERFKPFLNNMIGDFVPMMKINQINNFVMTRNAHVLSLIPQDFTIDSDLTENSGYYRTTTSVATFENVYGTANTIETRSVRVNGQRADWWPIYGNPDNGQCRWRIAENTGISLNPGINRLIVQAFDEPNGTGHELDRGFIDIWYDDSNDADISGTLASDMILDAASGPWHVTGDILVPFGITLTIQPGTTLFFESDTGIIVQPGGRLVAEGTQYQRIRFTRVPGSSDWDGIQFYHTLEDNRLCFVDHEFGDNNGESIDIQYSRVLIDYMTWGGTNNRILQIDHPTMICRSSVFPSVEDIEPLRGSGLSGDEKLIFDGCIFGTTTGYNDIINFSGGQRPGPIFQLYNSIFLGGGDDGPDLDGTDAHIEGNIFMNFHHDPVSDSTSNAIATGQDSGRISRINVSRNIFFNNDHAVLLKEDCFMRAQNNVFINTDIAAVSFGEPYRDPPRTPGGGAHMDDNIFWNNAEMFEHFFQDPNYGPTGDVIINSSILPSQWYYLGQKNIDGDPIFFDPNSDFRLKSMSPAIRSGALGSDMGAYVPAGAAICGEPYEITHRTNAALNIGGPGITHYKYSVNDPNGPWIGDFSVDTPVLLNNLVNGQSYTVYAIGKNSAGLWQSENNPTISRTWTIDTSHWQLVINEVLARNVEAVDHNGTNPDLIELYYDGPVPIELTDMSISDNPDNPRKFVFPGGITIEPNEYLVLYADDNPTTSGIHLGFGLDGKSECIYLYDSPSAGGKLLDSVEFGLQIPDLSIGRVGYDGRWMLTQPTFGKANTAQPLSDPALLKINEWFTNSDMLSEKNFIELYNPSTFPVSLGGLFLTDNPVTKPQKHKLAPLSFIPAAGMAVLIADGDPEDGLNHLNFKLSVNQEIIALFDVELNEIDKVIYGPQTTDVSQGRTPDGADTYAFYYPPTPGVSNIDTIVINEVLAHSPPGDTDWVELHNTTGNSIDIGGWFLSDNSGNRMKYEIAEGTIIEQNGYIVFYEDVNFGNPNDPGCHIPFALSENGEILCLSSGLDGVLTGYYKEQKFGASQTGVSFGRYLTSIDRYDFVSLDYNTPGGTNANPKVGPVVINEIMYNPMSVNEDEEFIELHNITGELVTLYRYDKSTPWKFTDGIDYTFSSGPVVTIQAYGYLVLAKDLAAFTASYGGMPPGVQVLDGYSGRLNNEGEKVQISMPGDVSSDGKRQYICIDFVRYYDKAPWPTEPDGNSQSLSRKVPSDYGNDVVNWKAATPSPGTANP